MQQAANLPDKQDINPCSRAISQTDDLCLSFLQSLVGCECWLPLSNWLIVLFVNLMIKRKVENILKIGITQPSWVSVNKKAVSKKSTSLKTSFMAHQTKHFTGQNVPTVFMYLFQNKQNVSMVVTNIMTFELILTWPSKGVSVSRCFLSQFLKEYIFISNSALYQNIIMFFVCLYCKEGAHYRCKKWNS